MTVSSETNKITYAGDGATASFSTSFTFAANGEVTVTLVDSAGAETEWTEGTEYTLAGANTGNAGTVTVDTSPTDYTPASGETLVIQLKPDYTQTTDLPRGGTVSPADTLEPMHDSRVRQILRLKDDVDRSVKVPISETTPGATLPLAATRANKVLAFDASGYPTVSTSTISAIESGATDAAASAAAASTSETNAATSESNASASSALASEWATKTDGQVASTDYASKAWAIGGTGVTDTASAGAAKEWATAAEDDLVDGSEYSAKHYSAKASASASAASTSETNAANSAAAAAASAAGIFWKEPVVNATTANITLSGEQTIDGVLTSTSRILVKNQTNAAENGVYVTASGAWARAIPLDTWDEHVGAAVIVSDGTTNADTAWICTVDAGGTLETTDITWGQLSQVYSTATTSSEGVTEYATAAEVTTGTDATRSITPDALANSNYGTAVVQILVFDDATDCATGDGAGDVFFRVPSTINGFDLVGVAAQCQTAGTTGTMDVQIHNVTQAADMLTTKITIDSAETDSSTAATAAVIDTANDDVATGDQIRIDVDAVHTTAAKGLLVELQFRLP
jgi:hypothetical protein